MKSITVRIPDTLQAALTTIGKWEKKAMSELVRHSLDNFVKVEQLKLLRQQAIPFAEKKDLMTDEDIFDYLK